MPAAAHQLLMAGVTSARDLGAPLKESIEVRDRINRGEIPGPTLYVAGPFIQHEPYPGTEAFRWGVKGAADGRAKVKKLADAGVNIIKLIDQDEMTMEEVKAVVDEAHAHKLPVVAHAHRPEEIRRGLAAGVDDFEHTGLSTAPGYPDDILKAIAERTAKMNIGPLFWCPTIEGLLNYGRLIDNPESLDDPAWKLDVPNDIVEDIKASIRHPGQLSYYQITPLRAADGEEEVSPIAGFRCRHACRHGQRNPDEVSQQLDLARNGCLGARSRCRSDGDDPRRNLLAGGDDEGGQGLRFGERRKIRRHHRGERRCPALHRSPPVRRSRDQTRTSLQVSLAATARVSFRSCV